MLPVVLCGGYGTRLWPLSRRAWPKQFADLGFKHSLFQQTILRLKGHPKLDSKPLIIANQQHRFLILQQLEDIGVTPADIILEPSARNTAAAVALAALWQEENKQADEAMLILPSDHLINKTDSFHKIISRANHVASCNLLAVFGIVPSYAETGYGYIETGARLSVTGNVGEDETNDKTAFSVTKFTEKPDENLARDYLHSGKHFWNSGMFAFTSTTYIEELNCYQPKLLKSCRQAWDNKQRQWEFTHPQAQTFNQTEIISIDYAVMEHTKKAAMLPLDADWNDLGSWKTVFTKQSSEIPAQQMIVTVNSDDCHVKSNGNRVIGLVGTHNLLIIDTDDALLIADAESSQMVGELTKELAKRQPRIIEQHAMTYRAWGWHRLLARTETCQIQQMHIKTNCGLSFRKHQYHFEHWTVTSGTATIRYEDTNTTINKHQSYFIPIGVAYSLSNQTDQPLEIISLQTGKASDFDNDLIRLKDDGQDQ